MNKEINYSDISIVYNSDIWSKKLADDKIQKIKQMNQFASIFSVLMFVLSLITAIDLKTPVFINIILIPFLTILPFLSFTIKMIEAEYGGYEYIYMFMRKIRAIEDIKVEYKNKKAIFEVCYKNGKIKKYNIYSFCRKMKLFDIEISYFGEPYGKLLVFIDITDPILANMNIKSFEMNNLDDSYLREKVIFYA